MPLQAEKATAVKALAGAIQEKLVLLTLALAIYSLLR